MTSQSSLASETIQMLVASMTQNGTAPLSELEAERFLNAVSRAQVGVPTGGRIDQKGI